MATTAGYVLDGAATVTIGGYVSSAGTTTMTDMGHTKSPVAVSPSFENFEVSSERSFGPIKIKPTGFKFMVKVPTLEMTPANMRIAYRQPSANITGTAPDQTLKVGQPSEQYQQLIVSGPGIGTTAVRTYTFYKAFVESVAENPIAKGDSQVLDITFAILDDDMIPTSNRYFSVVDA